MNAKQTRKTYRLSYVREPWSAPYDQVGDGGIVSPVDMGTIEPEELADWIEAVNPGRYTLDRDGARITVIVHAGTGEPAVVTKGKEPK